MRTRLLALVVLFLSAPLIRADDAAQVKQIIDRAVAAHAGSSERLDKLKRVQSSGKGVLKTVMGDANLARVIRAEWTDKPEYYSVSIEGTGPNGNVETVLILEGLTKGRQITGPKSTDFDFEATAMMSREVYAQWLGTLRPLRDGGLSLSLLPASKIDGSAVVGIKAEKKNRPTVDLFFDAQSGLLKRIGFPGLEGGGVEVRKELTFSDYKEFDGIRLPTKEVESHDGRRRYEWVNSDFKFPEKIERK